MRAPLLLSLLLVTTPAMAQVQGPPLTLDAAIERARRADPSAAAAGAGVDAATAARRVAALRPNPTVAVDVENIGASRAYDIVEAPKQTVSLAYPLELGGKRAARIGVADALGARAAIGRANADAELRLAVTQAYTDALAADRRLGAAQEQARIAADGLHAAQVRVKAGRASPLEESRAGVVRTNADVAAEQAARLATAARATLALRIGGAANGPLDAAWFDAVAGDSPIQRSGALTLAAARADVVSANARERLARAQRIPDVTVSAGVRRVPMVGSTAAVLGVSVPLPLFNGGRAGLDQARAERAQADALARAAELDAEQSVIKAETERDNAASAARAANGPTLAGAEEAARIARIGYREGKFGQLDLLDAERALIAAAVIPIAMLLTAFGMGRLGVSANLMSLGALDFGLIVDGAVIIVENALRRIAAREEAGGGPLRKPERLALVADASREMIRPSVYGQAIVMLVYLPLLTFSGVEGKTFEPMALTVLLALAFAFVLSLTFVPAAVATWIARSGHSGENRIVGWLLRRYEPGLDLALRRPGLTIGMAVGAMVIGAAAFTTLGQEFLPQLDEGDVLVSAFRVPSTSVEQSQRMQFQIERALAGMPEIRTVFSRTGTAEIASDPMPPNATDTFIMMKDRREWPDPSESKAEVVERIEQRLAGVPGHAYEVTQPIQMRFNELIAGVRSDVAVKVFGDDFASMNATAARIAAVLRRTPGAQDVKVEQTEGLPMLDVALKRDAASRLGVTAQDVADTVSAAVGGRESGQIYEGDRRFPIVVRLSDATRANLDTLGQTPVTTPQGASVPLASVADISIADGPNQISRENGKRRVVVQSNVRGRDVASVVADAQAAIARDVRLPTGEYLQWGGQFENLASARARLTIVVPACFAVILLLLYGALGSARDAALVFTGVPLALVGGVLALVLRGMPFSISAAVGFIALSGIAVLNGLVMLNAVQELARDGWDRAAAARQGALLRLRPVALTALVASLGFVPMALGHGAGAEVQKPLATVVIGGLISATLLTLFVLPALYARFGESSVSPCEGDQPPVAEA